MSYPNPELCLGRLEGFLDDEIAGRGTKFQPPQPPLHGYKHEMSRHQISQMLDAILMTFRVHIEARIAVGKGFYTIGPCGEETMAAVAHALQEKDTLALHNRQLGIKYLSTASRWVECGTDTVGSRPRIHGLQTRSQEPTV